MFNRDPAAASRNVSPLGVQVVETEYQPINGSQIAGVQVLSPTARERGRGGRDRVKEPGSPSLVLVLIRTYGLSFLVSVGYKLVSDVLQFANPLILKYVVMLVKVLDDEYTILNGRWWFLFNAPQEKE